MLGKSIFIIAEAGINHNGNRDMAFNLVEAAAAAGVDAIKFQTFNAEKLVTRTAPKAGYQTRSAKQSESQLEMLSNLELDYETYRALKVYSEQRNLLFMSTAFDSESLKFLTNDLQLKTLKIPSGEMTNGPLLLEYARTNRDLILSTGMSTLEEVGKALEVLAFGLVGWEDPSKEVFEEAFNTKRGQSLLKQRVALLHCTSQYPAPVDSLNLHAMGVLRDTFDLRVGYSDHSEGIVIPCAAVALGAEIIEKHFTLDRSLPGPDHRASLEPVELKQMVEAIRIVERALGNSEKAPQEAERGNREVARKSLVAAKDITLGQIFSTENLTVKRPGTGCSPMLYWSVLGTQAQREYLADELI
jgi:N-acetylneuraminate synthase